MSDLVKNQILSTYIPVMADETDASEVYRWLFTQATSNVLKRRPVGYDKFVKMEELEPEDMLELLYEVESQPDNWLVDVGRQKIAPQRDTQAIALRGAAGVTNKVGPNLNQDVKNMPLYDCYPRITGFMHQFAESMDSTLSRAVIVRLSPHGQVYRHYDMGLYYALRDRYHLVLDSEGSLMQVQDEFSTWHAGELWWFHNKLYHQAHNNSDKWRVHLIFDLLPRDNFELTKMIREVSYRDKIPEEKIRDTSLIA